MSTNFRILLFVSIASVFLAGCAGASDKYPSLAVRDAERVTGQFMPSGADRPAVPPVASAQEVGAIVASASALHDRFGAARRGAENLARTARGTGQDSDVRSRALVAVAGLTSLRGQTAIALSNLDDLESEALTTFAPVEEIRTAQAQVAHFMGEQDAALDSLTAQLR